MEKTRLAFDSTLPHSLADTPINEAANSYEGGGVADGLEDTDEVPGALSLGVPLGLAV